jgi:hypothetical protein
LRTLLSDSYDALAEYLVRLVIRITVDVNTAPRRPVQGSRLVDNKLLVVLELVGIIQ